jgi:hypothetical protein
MKKEVLLIKVSLDISNKLNIKLVKSNNKIEKEDLFIIHREEFLFKKTKSFNSFFEIEGKELLQEKELNNIYYSPYIIKLHMEEYLNEIDNNVPEELKEEIYKLYDFYIENSIEISMEEYKQINFKSA